MKKALRAASLRAIRHLALDMDGTIYKGGTLFEFTRPFLAQITHLGIGYTFLTNNSSRSVRDYLAHLGAMGLEIRAEQIYTSAQATIEYLREELPQIGRLFVLGTASLRAQFAGAGFELSGGGATGEPQAVIVGFDTELCYERLCTAAYWIQRGKPFIATHPDLICPGDRPTLLVDCGSICACLEKACGRGPDVVLGKPDARMLAGIMERHELAPHELAMVGDRLYTDIAMARAAGALGVLVLSGESRRADLQGCSSAPDLVVEDLRALGALLGRHGGAREGLQGGGS